LNGPCKIKFTWFVEKELKQLKCCDLTGPEKIYLFENIRVVSYTSNKNEVQKLWEKTLFFSGTVKKTQNVMILINLKNLAIPIKR